MATPAPWLLELQKSVGEAIGQTVIGISSLELEGVGLKVTGLAQRVGGTPFEFSVVGRFDVAEPAAPPPPEPPQYLFPYGTEFAVPTPEAPEIPTADDTWAWNAAQVPLIMQPVLNGFPGILEKKGGEAKLWVSHDRGVDQISKFVDVKKFLIDLPDDFMCEVNVGIERDGLRLPQNEQETLLSQSPQLGENDRVSVGLSDLMYLNEDLHEKDAGFRLETLQKMYQEKLAANPAMKLVPTQKAADLFQCTKAVGWGRDFADSQGVVAKVAGSCYTLTGKSDQLGRVSKQDPPPVNGVIMKADDADRIIYCVVLRPDFQDAQDDVMSADDVVQAAHYYLENARVIGLRHGKDPVQGEKPVPGAVLESYIAPVSFDFGNGRIEKGDWVIALRVDDQGIWDKIQSGEYQGVSVGGVGARQDLQ